MTEFLSMTLLSAEPVSAAKMQTASSSDAAMAPDQSFAATLAAEVNGKGAEKSVKASAKTRQNTATESVNDKNSAVQTGQSELKSENEKVVADKATEQSEDSELTTPQQEDTLAHQEKNQDGQSHWLNLLEKAKNLQDRLSKANAETKEQAETKTDAKQTDTVVDSAANSGSTEKTLALANTLAAQAATKQQTEQTKVLDQTETEPASTGKTKIAAAQDGAVVLNEKLQSAQDSEQHLTAEELKALKLIAQPEKTATKIQVTEVGVKQLAAQQSSGSEQDSAEPVENTKNLLQSSAPVHQHTGPEQNKILAPIEKTLKVQTQVTQSTDTEQQSDSKDKLSDIETVTAAETSPLVASKAPQQSGQNNPLPKSVVTIPVNAEQAVKPDAATEDEPVASAVAVSVQAQSAAAVVAPTVQQPKAAAPDAKVTTEEALKQIQSTAMNAQTEQGSSSAGEHSSQQGAADTGISLLDGQKSIAAVAAEPNSFSNQLKSSLEKTASAMTVAGRELVSEQKQVDQLGQKLNLIQPEASNQLKEQMLMMVRDKVHTAEIRLDPSELGSMQIKISLQQDQMSVQFMVQQGSAKELMEQQMPKLRELLQQQGIELSQGSVQQQSQSSGQDSGRRTASGHTGGTELDSSEEMTGAVMQSAKNSDRVVDYYA